MQEEGEMSAIRVIKCMACGAPSMQDVIACEYCGIPIRFLYLNEACRALMNSGEPTDIPATLGEDYIYFEKEEYVSDAGI